MTFQSEMESARDVSADDYFGTKGAPGNAANAIRYLEFQVAFARGFRHQWMVKQELLEALKALAGSVAILAARGIRPLINHAELVRAVEVIAKATLSTELRGQS